MESWMCEGSEDGWGFFVMILFGASYSRPSSTFVLMIVLFSFHIFAWSGTPCCIYVPPSARVVLPPLL